ncbi:hypothetical protein [Agreia sp. COWG]|uniref:hypothetical protein n=1 Tax=Agreia sp. COWG TaxID=2773266 RepID=UPI00192640D6|nr:hypothetical protein [Agreia sp. COWG]CAD5994123.1 conserved protein of unknown function [Agreia sp. COWG]
MRTEPPAGDDFERMIVRITENVLLTAGSQLPAAASVPKPRFRFGALSIVVLVLLGLGAAGGAVAIGLVSSPWPAVNPTATTSSDATPTRTPQPTATAAAPVVPALPTVAIADASFSPPSWGQGMAVDLSGFAPNTDFSVSVDSHYSAGSTTPDEYFSVLTTPITVTTDGRGAVSFVWTPDSFPQNIASTESGHIWESRIRVDAVGGPERDPSGSAYVDPIAASGPLPIHYLPIDEVSVQMQTCVEPEMLTSQQAGLPVTLTGLVAGETVYLRGARTDTPTSYALSGEGVADDQGRAVVVVSGYSDSLVSTSAAIAPAQWQVTWLGSDRATASNENPLGSVPLTIGGCG